MEIGCGYSTCVIFDTADRFLTPRPEISCFDPYPDVPHALTQPDDPLRQAIQAIPLQEIPNEVFTSLEPGDILFIDSSHIARTGSDVLDYMCRALPLITPGVFVQHQEFSWNLRIDAGGHFNIYVGASGGADNVNQGVAIDIVRIA